jgi:hypothetical protein
LGRAEFYLPFPGCYRIIASKDPREPANIGRADSFLIVLKPKLHRSLVDPNGIGFDL